MLESLSFAVLQKICAVLHLLRRLWREDGLLGEGDDLVWLWAHVLWAHARVGLLALLEGCLHVHLNEPGGPVVHLLVVAVRETGLGLTGGVGTEVPLVKLAVVVSLVAFFGSSLLSLKDICGSFI